MSFLTLHAFSINCHVPPFIKGLVIRLKKSLVCDFDKATMMPQVKEFFFKVIDFVVYARDTTTIDIEEKENWQNVLSWVNIKLPIFTNM